MSKSPLEVLKTGLSELKKHVKARKADLLARLGKKEKLTNEEVEWLDHTANFVDEEAVVSLLEKASDYEHGLSQLSPQHVPTM
jgi:hypothetical protein